MPRHHPKGWPEKESFMYDDQLGNPSFDREGFDEALAKAKKESVYFENLSHVQALINEYIKPDTFLEIDGEVTLGNPCAQVRQVAHLKPVQSNPVVIPDQSDYATEEEFFNACRERRKMMKGEVEEDTMSDAEMHEALEALKDPKDARIKELEQDNAEGFDKYQELLIVNRNLKERWNELEFWKKQELLIWGPVLNYCHNDENAKRLGIGPGQSISTRILEILKEYK